VGLNLIYLVPAYTGGTETYARELIPALARADPSLRLTAFVNRETAEAEPGPWHEHADVVTVPVNARRRTQWVRGEQQLLPSQAQQAGVDLVHSLANTGPTWGAFHRLVTIHDLHYRIVPEAHLGLLGWGMRLLVPVAARRSHRILVPTASTRDDLSRLLGIPSDKVDVVPEGTGVTPPATPPDASPVRRWLGAGSRRIVLCVSAKRPHKNLARLIGALALIPADQRPLLVLPGYWTPHEEELRRLAFERGVASEVRFLGWIDQHRLEGLYAAADCFVFPSLYEGFGLPVLEAMARGVPVACSDRGALVEVAGDAAHRFDPESEPAISGAIRRLLSDSGEARRLREAGLGQAGRFTWSSAAAGTLAAYERTLSSPR
jgi:glycosyltransferase involved in cell wall biosynthesis